MENRKITSPLTDMGVLGDRQPTQPSNQKSIKQGKSRGNV